MKKSLMALAICALSLELSFAEMSQQPVLSCWQSGISDYIDYRPGEAVIRRDYWDNVRSMGVCKQDTVQVPDLVASMLANTHVDIIGSVLDTLMTVCDSASVDALLGEKYGVDYFTTPFTDCAYGRVYSILPIEVFRNEQNVRTDTLAGYFNESLESGNLVEFLCDSSCSAFPFKGVYIESGDSVMLCSKDSVLRRNGVCLDLQALRDTAGSVNVRPWPKEGDASVDSAPRVARTTRFSRFGSMLKMDVAKAGMLEVSAVDGKILRRAPVFPGERWLDLSAFAPGFLAIRVGGASTSLYWEGSEK